VLNRAIDCRTRETILLSLRRRREEILRFSYTGRQEDDRCDMRSARLLYSGDYGGGTVHSVFGLGSDSGISVLYRFDARH